jgi:pimeloyl-ACP methyl ester carboxylesterase
VAELPAAVLVAPWVSHSTFAEGFRRLIRLDPVGCALMSLTWTATPLIHTSPRAARALITEGAMCTPAELRTALGPESALVLYQHNPPFWSPPETVQTPMLWLAAEKDSLISEAAQRRSAAHYRADYVVVDQAGHDLMLEGNYCQTAETIHHWLVEQALT